MGSAVPRFVRLTTVLFAMLSAGCALDHSLDDRSSIADAPTDVGCITPLGPEGWVPAETGDCLGIGVRECAGCHTRDGGYVLRPAGASPPPGVVMTPPAPGTCGLCR